MVAKLLRTSMLRYEQAAIAVLQEAPLPCACDRPGESLRCETCPCLKVFENRVRQKLGAQPIVKEVSCESGFIPH